MAKKTVRVSKKTTWEDFYADFKKDVQHRSLDATDTEQIIREKLSKAGLELPDKETD